MNSKSIHTIDTDFSSLEITRNKLISEFMSDIRKTIGEWSTLLSVSEFKSAIKHMYIEHKLSDGTKTIIANPESIQPHFELFVQNKLISNDRFMHINNRFFNLKKFHTIPTTRHSNEIDNYNIKDNILIYKYSGLALNGFNRIDISVVQELHVSLNTRNVIYYYDSTENIHSNNSRYDINTDFINKLF